MDFIYEEDYLTITLSDFVNDGFKALFKLAFVLSSSHQCAHIQREYLLRAEVLGNITAYYTLCKTFGYGRFTCTGFAYKHRVVLGTTAKDLKYSTNLLVTTDDRVKFAFASAFAKVDGIFRQGVVLFFSALVCSLLAFTQLGDGCFQFFGRNASILKYGTGRRVNFKDSAKHSLERDIFVSVSLGYIQRLLHHIVGTMAQIWLSAAYFGLVGDGFVYLTHYLLEVGAELLKDEFDQRVAFLYDSFEEMHRFNSLSSRRASNLYGLLNGFL